MSRTDDIRLTAMTVARDAAVIEADRLREESRLAPSDPYALGRQVMAAFRAEIEAKARPTVDEIAAALHAEGVGCWSPRSVCPGPPEHHVRSAAAILERLR